MNLLRILAMLSARLAILAAMCIPHMASASQIYTYNFAWYGGAPQTWVYEAAAKFFVDVYEDTSTAENDVLFRVRNGLDTELGYMSRIGDLHIDTGSLNPDMFANVSLAEISQGVRYFMYTPGVDKYLYLDLIANSIRFTADYAAGVVQNQPVPEDGIHPGEYIVLRAVLKEGFTFNDVVSAMNTGMSTTYMEGDMHDWTNAEKLAYRSGAPMGLRFVMLVQSTVPNWWHQDGQGAFVTHALVAATDDHTPVISSASATPATLLDTETSQLAVVATDPDNGPQPLSYAWSIVSGGGLFSDALSPNPIYYPEDVTEARSVELRVDVSDGESTVSRTLTLQVNDAHAPPPNVAPQINNLSATPTTFLDTETSQLSVTASDADAGPQVLSYQWSIVNGGGQLSDAASPTPVYTPADVVGSQPVTLRVTVSDGEASVSGELTVTVEDANPPPPGATLLTENFSGDTLEGWTVQDEGTVDGPSQWRIVSGELAQLSNIRDGSSTSSLVHLGTYLVHDNGLGWSDYRTKFKLRSADDDGLGVMFRFRDSANYYRFSWNAQLKQRRLVKRVDGVFTLLAADNVPYVQNQVYQVELVAQGGQLEVWIDGARIFQVSDPDHAYGSIAFYTWQDKGAYFDDVLVEDLSGGNFNALPQITALSADPTHILDTGISNLTVSATDPDDGPQALSYQWTIVNGGGTLDNANSPTPVFTPADIAGTQSVTLKVQVSDGAATVSGNLSLTVEDANPPPLGPELLAEDFSGGSLAGWSVHDEGTVDAPSKWQVTAGELAQLSNIRDGSASTSLVQHGTYLAYDNGLGWSDYRARFKLRSADDDGLGVMFRLKDSANYYRFSWNKQLKQRRLVKKTDGVFTLLAADNVPYNQNQDYQVELVLAGGLLEVWIDGVRIFQVNDPDHAQGTIAFYTWQDKGAYFDDVQVNEMP